MSHELDAPELNVWHENEQYEQTPSRPLSGPGTSRQTRRLQLRNAGFRAAAVPTRKITPKSMSSSTNWSSVSGVMSGSDAENISPSSGVKPGAVKVEKRRSSGILQEIGSGSQLGYNNTLTRPKKPRPALDQESGFGQGYSEVYEGAPSSPPLPSQRNSIRIKSLRPKPKISKTRRSMSGEARMYIDHLERELATAQEQLRAVSSPSVTRQQSSKMRTMTAETRQLQEEIAEWEAKYEQRVQEIEEEHAETESSLRLQLRRLEEDAEESKYRLEELETELDSSRQCMSAAEEANVNLERRLEIMSDLLAASPTKLDLHTATPGMSRKHQRPKSMLPRFPTASSLLASPERLPRTQPPSPLMSFADLYQPPSASHSNSDLLSDAGSVFFEAPSTAGGSTTSLERSETLPNFNPWTLNAVQSAKARPARRMRRFGQGSHGPKPLILPSTSHCEFVPASAPPLERSETTPAFSFPIAEGFDDEEEDSPSSLLVRRRASTTADRVTLANLEASPFSMYALDRSGVIEDSTLSARQPRSAESRSTPRNLSSLGSMAGRNLMDELCALETSDSSHADDHPHESAQDTEAGDEGDETTIIYPNDADSNPNIPSLLRTNDDPTDSFLVVPSQSQTQSQSRNTLTHTSSLYNRLRTLFADLWRSPVALAQHLVQTAQLRMLRIPEPLRNVQWWLVGILLGPMARRRVLVSGSRSRSISRSERRPLLEAYTPVGCTAEEDLLAYGTLCYTPPSSPTSSMTIAGKGGKHRAGSNKGVNVGVGSRDQHIWAKHSPWVWLKFSITLAFAVGVAFKEGPGSLLGPMAVRGRGSLEGRKERKGVRAGGKEYGGE